MKGLVTIGLGAVFAAAMAFAQNAPAPPAGGTAAKDTGAADANGVNRTGRTDSSVLQIQSHTGSVVIPDTLTYEEGNAGYARSGRGGAYSGTAAQGGGANRQGQTGSGARNRTGTSGQQH
jgi:hypothetical protein